MLQKKIGAKLPKLVMSFITDLRPRDNQYVHILFLPASLLSSVSVCRVKIVLNAKASLLKLPCFQQDMTNVEILSDGKTESLELKECVKKLKRKVTNTRAVLRKAMEGTASAVPVQFLVPDLPHLSMFIQPWSRSSAGRIHFSSMPIRRATQKNFWMLCLSTTSRSVLPCLVVLLGLICFDALGKSISWKSSEKFCRRKAPHQMINFVCCGSTY